MRITGLSRTISWSSDPLDPVGLHHARWPSWSRLQHRPCGCVWEGPWQGWRRWADVALDVRTRQLVAGYDPAHDHWPPGPFDRPDAEDLPGSLAHFLLRDGQLFRRTPLGWERIDGIEVVSIEGQPGQPASVRGNRGLDMPGWSVHGEVPALSPWLPEEVWHSAAAADPTSPEHLASLDYDHEETRRRLAAVDKTLADRASWERSSAEDAQEVTWPEQDEATGPEPNLA